MITTGLLTLQLELQMQSVQKQDQYFCKQRRANTKEVPRKVLILVDDGFRCMRCGQQMHLHGRISLQYMYVIKEETSWDEMLSGLVEDSFFILC